MGIVKNLENIIKLQEELDKDIETNYYSTDYSRIKDFLENKLLSSPKRYQNANEIVDHLDLVIKYTNFKNYEWLTYPILFANENYFVKLAESLKYFPFKDNLGQLINSVLGYNIKTKFPELLDKLYCDEMLDSFIELKLTKNFSGFFSQMSPERRKVFVEKIKKSGLKIDFSNYELIGEKDNSLINDNILYLADASANIFELREKVKDDKKTLEILKSYIDNNPDKVVSSIIDTSRKINSKDDTIREVIKLIILDVAKNEKANLSDIELKSGGFSTVIIIKDKVIKIGELRSTKVFANNPYIIKPLLRKTLTTNDGNECFVEVTERVEPLNSYTNETSDKIYEIYKGLRKLGLEWTDVNTRNVGILLKDNEVHWNGDLALNDERLELFKSRSEKVLKKGDLVILDADFIYDINDNNIKYPDSYMYLDFKRRYEDENFKRFKGYSALKLLLLLSFNMVLILSFIVIALLIQ